MTNIHDYVSLTKIVGAHPCLSDIQRGTTNYFDVLCRESRIFLRESQIVSYRALSYKNVQLYHNVH